MSDRVGEARRASLSLGPVAVVTDAAGEGFVLGRRDPGL